PARSASRSCVRPAVTRCPRSRSPKLAAWSLMCGQCTLARVKVLISVDMEGISGVATRRETATGWPPGMGKGDDYERARLWMTADANAAIAGAAEAGATEI